MIKKKSFLILILIYFLLSFSCATWDNTINEYEQQELARIEAAIHEILAELNYKDYHLLIIPHAQYVGPENQKIMEYESFKGTGFIPEGPPGAEQSQVPPNYKDLGALNGSYSRRILKIDYNEELKQDPNYRLEYISVLLIFDNISQDDMDKLIIIFEEIVINTVRGDTVVIISK